MKGIGGEGGQMAAEVRPTSAALVLDTAANICEKPGEKKIFGL